MIRLGVRKFKAIDKRAVVNVLGEPGLPAIIKAEDPEALVCYRFAYTTHDPDPEAMGWPHGSQLLDMRWDEMQQIGLHNVDYWILCNEWGGNVSSVDFITRFCKFYRELIDACIARGVKCTICDFASGHPGLPTISAEAAWYEPLRDLFAYAAAHGFAVGWHVYDLLDRYGNRMPRDLTLTRFSSFVAEFPNLIIIGTEGGNATKDGTSDDGMFRADNKLPTTTKQYMKQHAAYVKGNLWSICWWELCWPEQHTNAEANWALDDWTSIWWWYVDWMCSY